MRPIGRGRRWPPKAACPGRRSGGPGASSGSSRIWSTRSSYRPIRSSSRRSATWSGLYLDPPERALVLCVDEKSGIQALGRRAIEFKKFLTKIDSQIPADLDVHLVCDNLSTHKTPAIAKWLAAHPRFHLHFTPTSSSWLNQVERWFGLLTDKQLRRGVHKSVQTLEKDIRAWVATWNENPRSFAWTKTADEIFERLNSYLQRIPDAGH
jgi:transposase